MRCVIFAGGSFPRGNIFSCLQTSARFYSEAPAKMRGTRRRIRRAKEKLQDIKFSTDSREALLSRLEVIQQRPAMYKGTSVEKLSVQQRKMRDDIIQEKARTELA